MTKTVDQILDEVKALNQFLEEKGVPDLSSEGVLDSLQGRVERLLEREGERAREQIVAILVALEKEKARVIELEDRLEWDLDNDL